MPVESNWRVDRLIQYCMCPASVSARDSTVATILISICSHKVLTKFALNVSQSAKQRPYFTMAMSEPLVMRGALALSCAVWTTHVPSLDRAVAYEGLYQKTQAIKDINRELNRSGLSQVSDAMIVAVANLANVAVGLVSIAFDIPCVVYMFSTYMGRNLRQWKGRFWKPTCTSAV
jgi:hypothetical protein